MNDKIDDFEMPENYPETLSDKAHYAEYCVQKSLESISASLWRMSRVRTFVSLGSMPNIITNNETKMALKHLAFAMDDFKDAYKELRAIFDATKDAPTTEATAVSAGELKQL